MYFATGATKVGKTAAGMLNLRKRKGMRKKITSEMNRMDEIKIKSIDNPFEKEILLYLKQNGKSIYGEIIKELKISGRRGQEAINSLLNKGFVKYPEKSTHIELNVDLKA
jgi:predicted transcriptional regulator